MGPGAAGDGSESQTGLERAAQTAGEFQPLTRTGYAKLRDAASDRGQLPKTPGTGAVEWICPLHLDHPSRVTSTVTPKSSAAGPE